MIDGLRRNRPAQEDVAGILQGFGAYTGEVIVRRAAARWVDFDPEQRELFRQPVGVLMPNGRAWNPLGKVVKRFEAGPEESVQQMYLLMHGRAPRPPARRLCVGSSH
ncbi:hypothetical protein GCM10020367_39450 [Streptomyces sannanensis]|uniref:Uncharacterized protein n=1 Tax=Streptomyces sannanensis TaxID=285536 RepID=A0ABP6SF02_9ACTN